MVTQDINTDIRFFKPNDPYYYEVDNLPLLDLLKNDVILRDEINKILDVSINHATIGYVDDEVQLAIGDDTKVNINIPPNAGSAPFGNILEWVEAQLYGSNELWGLTDVHSGTNNDYNRRDETYLRYNAGDQKYYHDSTEEVMGRGLLEDMMNVGPDWLGEWNSGDVISVQNDINYPNGIRFRMVSAGGGAGASEMNDLVDVSLGGATWRGEGDIPIWNTTLDQFKRAFTQYTSIYTEHSIFHEPDTYTPQDAVASTSTAVGWTTVSCQYAPLSTDSTTVIDYAYLCFHIVGEGGSGSATPSITYRLNSASADRQVAHGHGTSAAGTDTEVWVAQKVPVENNSVGKGKFSFQYKSTTGQTSKIRIGILGVWTTTLVRTIGETQP